jgi:alkanesulfonate monooxygenase SsuD/methylene tetrahydromethanopterin reductase-like flavin-dependent oxidoreductase (luciferase family)
VAEQTQSKPMSFGYVLAGQYLPEDDPQVRLAEALEQVRAARQAGFTSIWATQHFLADFQFLQTVPFLARLSAEAEGMQVGSAVLLAPLYPPVLLAEEVATMDVLAGGRFVLGVGAGYRNAEFDAFGVPRKERLGRLAETVALLRRLWTGDTVSFHGKHLHLDDARLRLLPVQRERLPVWVGAQGPKGLKQAAEIGDEWLVSPELSLDAIAERQQVYRDALPAGQSSIDKVFPVMREAFAARDYDRALAVAGPALARKYTAYVSWGHDVGAFDDMARSSFVLGDVDSCVEQVERYRSTLGTSFLGLRMQWPGLDQREVLESIEAFAQVIDRCSA